jgi:hypothetical protein
VLEDFPVVYPFLDPARAEAFSHSSSVFIPTAMGHAGDLEKWDVEDDAHGFSASKVITKDAATDEALDAEANIDAPAPATNSTPEQSSDPGPPPNGGFAAWLQVAGSFFLFFNGW